MMYLIKFEKCISKFQILEVLIQNGRHFLLEISSFIKSGVTPITFTSLYKLILNIIDGTL